MPHATTCRLLTHAIDEWTLVRLVGERITLTEADALWLRERLLRLVEEERLSLSLDLANVRFLTSTMVETLLDLHRRLKSLGGRLCVCNLTPAVAEIFNVLQLSSILDVRTTFSLDACTS